MSDNTIKAAEAFELVSLITPTEQGIASRVLARTTGGNLTLFAFDKGQGLSEHSAPFDAIVQVISGELTLIIDGKPIPTKAGDIVKMPANIPHSVEAPQASKMLLIMLREPKE